MGSSIALYEGKFNGLIFSLAILTTTLYQILSNFANDYGDGIKGTDENRIGPTRALQAGLLTKNELKNGLIITGILSFISTILLLYISFLPNYFNYFILFIGLGIAAILAAIFYTMGKNPYGYSGFGDVFVFVFFGIVGVAGSYFLFTKTFDWMILLPAFSVGFFSVSVLNLNNMRDIENDKLVGKNTLAVKMGLKYAKIYQYILMILPFYLSLIFVLTTVKPNYNFYHLIFMLLILVPIRKEITKIDEPKLFDPYLKKTALLTLVFVIIFALGLNHQLLF